MTATYNPLLKDYYTHYQPEEETPLGWFRWLHEELFSYHILYSMESRSRFVDGMMQSLRGIIEKKFGAKYRLFVPYWLVVAPDQANHSVHAHMLVQRDHRLVLEGQLRRILKDFGHHLHVSDSTGEQYKRTKIQYAVFKHLNVPGADVAMYNPKAAPAEFWEEQERRKKRLCHEVESALEALPIGDWKRILAQAEKGAGRGAWTDVDRACPKVWQAAWIREAMDRRGLWNWPQVRVPDDRDHCRRRKARAAPECRREPRLVHGQKVIATICPPRRV